MLHPRASPIVVLAAVLFLSPAALAKSFTVGPGQTYTQLTDVVGQLRPGDIVRVMGNATYSPVTFRKAGAANNPITIQGVAVDGNRPIISGGKHTVDFAADHYVFVGFELTAGTTDCIFHEADDITLTGLVVHGCAQFGLLGSDTAGGSLTLQYSEFYANAPGASDTHHQIYMATSHDAHPGATFRMQFCYIHDGLSGNNVKSRAERYEIYYNWIEHALYHELELIGADPTGGDTFTPRNSDVVGNVLVSSGASQVMRWGGDGTGAGSKGMVRAVNNTIVQDKGGAAVFWLNSGIASAEMHNNLIYVPGGGSTKIYDDSHANWVNGEQIAGSYNAIPSASPPPPGWTKSLTGADPKLTNSASEDYSLLAGSPLIDAGGSPIVAPIYVPPQKMLLAPGTGVKRPIVGKKIDIGAFEYGTRKHR